MTKITNIEFTKSGLVVMDLDSLHEVLGSNPIVANITKKKKGNKYSEQEVVPVTWQIVSGLESNLQLYFAKFKRWRFLNPIRPLSLDQHNLSRLS